MKSMTLTEARNYLDARAVNRPSFDGFPAAPYIEAFEQLPEDSPERGPFLEAIWILLRDGSEVEQAVAATFMSKFSLPVELKERAVDLYLERRLDCRHPLGVYLSQTRLPEASVQRIRQAFDRAPATQVCFADTLFRADPALWDTLVKLLASTNDPSVVYHVFYVAWIKRRQGELVAVLRQKPESVLRGAVALGATPELLTLCGLRP